MPARWRFAGELSTRVSRVDPDETSCQEIKQRNKIDPSLRA